MTLQPRSQPLNINLNCLKASIREATPDIYAERTGSIFLDVAAALFGILAIGAGLAMALRFGGVIG